MLFLFTKHFSFKRFFCINNYKLQQIINSKNLKKLNDLSYDL